MNGYTVTYEKTDDGWWFAQCVEVPEAFTQGRTLEEAEEMIRDALRLTLECKREIAERRAAERGEKIARVTL